MLYFELKMLQLLVVALETCLFYGKLIAFAAPGHSLCHASALEISLAKKGKCDFEVGLHQFVKIFGCQSVQGLPFNVYDSWIRYCETVVTH